MNVEIEVLMGLDPESEKALENVVKASRFLFERFFVRSIIVTRNTFKDDFVGSVYGIPSVVVNGHILTEGRAPSEHEVVDFILNKLGFKTKSYSITYDGRAYSALNSVAEVS